MNNKLIIAILVILLIGVVYRLALTANGSFLFNMDNGRDMVDVREMVVLGKPRLTGPTSAIDGFYNGPAWYYLLSIPFILSGGDPYASILLEIGLWVIGGFFLLKLVSRWGNLLIVPIGIIWVSSDYIVLTNLYAFNPNPVTLLAPLFVYLLVEYLEKEKVVYGLLTWILGGLFFNFEMNIGVFIPSIIVTSMILTKKFKLFKQKWFWLGLGLFIVTLLPQVIFDLKHQFIMSKAILRHLSESSGGSFNLLMRSQTISLSFYNTFLPTLLNHKIFTLIILGLFVPLSYWFVKTKKKNIAVYVSLIFISIPFLGYVFLPVSVNPWHLGGEMTVSLILIAYVFRKLLEKSYLGKIIFIILSVSVIWFGVFNIGKFFVIDRVKPNLDPSLYKNEINAIDYVYQKAEGKNFKVYVYLPSIYDYPYQYLIWWYGQKRYGYLPIDYAYAPNKTTYISNKIAFSAVDNDKRQDSNLVFLIKEPNRNYTRFGWEGEFIKLKSINKEMVGSIEIEIRKEL